MASWNNKLPTTLENKSYERGDVTKQGGLPPIRVVPPKEDDEKKKNSVSFYFNEDMSIKDTYDKFTGSEAEQGIVHVMFFYQFLAKKGITAVIDEQTVIRDDNRSHLRVMDENDNGRQEIQDELDAAVEEIENKVTEALDLFEQLLGSALVADWNTTCRNTLEVHGYINENDLYISNRALGKIGMRSIDACLKAWLRLKVPKDCAERHRRYISTQIVCPASGYSKGLKIKTLLIRVKEMNTYLEYMPCLKDTKNAPPSMPRANKPFEEYELCIYMLTLLPTGFKEMYYARKGEHFPCNVEQLIEDLDRMEPEYLANKKMMAEIRAIKQSTGTSSARSSGSQKSNKRKMEPGETIPKREKRASKLCQHCAQWSPQIKGTHNTKDCLRWNSDGTEKQKRGSSSRSNYKGSNAHSMDEMKEVFATMKKQNEKLLKYVKKSKKSRRGRRGYESSGSDSDSE